MSQAVETTSTTPVGTVWVLDDDRAVRDSFCWLIAQAGLRAQAFARPQDLLAQEPPVVPCCLLLDVRMPEMDGLEVQRRLHEAGWTAPIIFVTGHGDVPMAIQALKGGGFDFVEKPLDDELLLQRIRQALQEDQRQRQDPFNRQTVVQRVSQLTPREREVMDAVVAGNSNRQIAVDLGLSPKTIEVYRARVMQKMRADSLPALVRMLVRASL